MRRGLDGLAMLVQQVFSEDPFSGAVYAFRGRKAGQLKLLWHDGIALCMLTAGRSMAHSSGRKVARAWWHFPLVSWRHF